MLSARGSVLWCVLCGFMAAFLEATRATASAVAVFDRRLHALDARRRPCSSFA